MRGEEGDSAVRVGLDPGSTDWDWVGGRTASWGGHGPDWARAGLAAGLPDRAECWAAGSRLADGPGWRCAGMGAGGRAGAGHRIRKRLSRVGFRPGPSS